MQKTTPVASINSMTVYKILMCKLFIFIFSSAVYANTLKNPCPQKISDLPYNYKKGSFFTSVIDKRSVQKIFTQIQNPKLNLSLDYVVDGCDMRAYLISKSLQESNNLNTFRVAVETKSSKGLVVRTNKTHEGLVEFSRHTATAICVLDLSTKSVEPYVLDPVFFTEPVKLESWVQKFTYETKVKTNLYFSSMYSLNPKVKRKSFHDGEMQEAQALQKLFFDAYSKHKKSGTKPYGIGLGRENIRESHIINGSDSTIE